MDLRGPERLVGVDVADARDESLVEQRPLHARAARPQATRELALVEGGVERVARDVGDLVRDAQGPGLRISIARDVRRRPARRRVAQQARARVARGRRVGHQHRLVKGHRAEDALVDEGEAAPAEVGVDDVEADAEQTVGGGRQSRIAQQHLPAHAEVGHEGERLGRLRGRCEREPQELAATHGREQRRPGQPVDEVVGGPVVTSKGSRFEDLDVLDHGAGDGGVEAGADDLDLGQFRQAAAA